MIDLSLINKHRRFLMGLAAFWIVVYHSSFFDFRDIEFLSVTHIGDLLEILKRLGNAAVEVFLFLSGIGLYYSMSKDSKLTSFYKKRFFRVVPSSFIIVVTLCGFLSTTYLPEYFSQITFVDLFVKSEVAEVAWYVSAILVFYLFFPLIYKAVKRFGLIAVVVISLVSIIFTFALGAIDYDYFMRVEVFLTRIPAFVTGAYLGKVIMKGVKIPRWGFLAIILFNIVYTFLSVFLIIQIQEDYGFIRHYINFPLALSFLFVFAFLREAVGSHIITRFFEMLGLFSLEYYLIHVNMYQYCLKFFNTDEETGLKYAITIIVVSFVLAVIVKSVADKISGYLNPPVAEEKK